MIHKDPLVVLSYFIIRTSSEKEDEEENCLGYPYPVLGAIIDKQIEFAKIINILILDCKLSLLNIFI